MTEPLMQAAVLTGIGGPDQLVVRDDVPRPVPARGEVLIKVAACGVNNTDINTRTGWYSTDASDAATGWRGSPAGLGFPRIQGADVVGTVAAVGPGVESHLVGQRVLVDPWVRRGADNWLMLGSEVDGGFAQFCVVPAVNAHRVETDLSDIELGSVPCSWATALNMLERAGVAAGEQIVVTGASGGVGTAAVQIAQALGANVVAVVGRDKAPAVAALGAVTVARESDDPVGEASALCGGAPEVVVDVVGGAQVPAWLSALRRGGRFVTAGAIAGPIARVDLRTLYLNDLTLLGVTTYPPELFGRLMDLLGGGSVRPVVAASYPLAQIHQAQADFEQKRHVGGLVLVPDP